MGKRRSTSLGLAKMECQNCFRRATVHITEVASGGAFEVHFCEEHAAEYVATTPGARDSLLESLPDLSTPPKRLMRYSRRRFFTE